MFTSFSVDIASTSSSLSLEKYIFGIINSSALEKHFLNQSSSSMVREYWCG